LILDIDLERNILSSVMSGKAHSTPAPKENPESHLLSTNYRGGKNTINEGSTSMGSIWLDVVSNRRYETHMRENPSGANTLLTIERSAEGPIEAEALPERAATKRINGRSCSIRYELKERNGNKPKVYTH
jgi:hypothetical protein